MNKQKLKTKKKKILRMKQVIYSSVYRAVVLWSVDFSKKSVIGLKRKYSPLKEKPGCGWKD